MPVYPTPFYSLEEKKKKQKKREREREWGVALGGKHALKCICYNTHHKEGGKEERKKERKKEKEKRRNGKVKKKKDTKCFFWYLHCDFYWDCLAPLASFEDSRHVRRRYF